MSQTYETGFRTTLGAKLAAADTTATLATVPTVTKGRMLIKSRDGQTKEWISFTGVSGSTITGLTRNLSLTAVPATGGTGLDWVAGTQVVLIAMHDQLVDKQEGFPPQSFTTAQLSARTGKVVGETFYDSTQNLLVYWNGSAYTAYSGAASVANATTTSTGGIELPTDAETIAGTDTGSVGPLATQPSQVAKNTQSGTFIYAAAADVSDTYTASLVPALTAYATGMSVRIKFTTANTGACTLNLNGLGAKAIKLIDGTDPLDGDIAASGIYTLTYDGTNFVLESTAVRAVAADITAGTNTLKFVTPKQANDTYLMVTDVVLLTRVADAASGAVAYNHGLGKAPKVIKFDMINSTGAAAIITSNGAYDGSTNSCIYRSGGYNSGNSGSSSILYDEDGGTKLQAGAVSSTSTTTFTITWTKTGAPATDTMQVVATLLA